MKKAIVDVPAGDDIWFKTLMEQNRWIWEWMDNGKEYPEYVED